MKHGSLIALLILPAAGGCATTVPEQDLGRLIAFADPPRCRFAPTLDRLFSDLLIGGEQGPSWSRLAVEDFPPLAVRRTPLDREWVRARVDLRGRWQGLRVVAIGADYVLDSDSPGYWIRFAGSPARVTETLNRLGMRLDPRTRSAEWSEQENVGEDEVVKVGYSQVVVARRGGSELHCSAWI